MNANKRGRLPRSPGPRALDLPMIAAALVDRSLNDSLQPALIVLLQGNEAERLQAPGKRAQHFRGTKHHAGRGQDHQFAIASSVDWMRHRKQPTGQGYNFQFARNAAAVFESQHRRSGFREMYSCSPRTGLRWREGERLHTWIKYLTREPATGDYGRACPEPVTAPIFRLRPRSGTCRTTPADAPRILPAWPPSRRR